MQNLQSVIMEQATAWVNDIVRRAQAVQTPQDLMALEDTVHQTSRQLAGKAYQQVSQILVQQSPPPKACPICGQGRQHKGQRDYTCLTRMGPVTLSGVYWYCPACQTGTHAAEVWVGGTISPALGRSAVLLGTALASFKKAEAVCRKVLGISLSAETLRTLCR